MIITSKKRPNGKFSLPKRLIGATIIALLMASYIPVNQGRRGSIGDSILATSNLSYGELFVRYFIPLLVIGLAIALAMSLFERLTLNLDHNTLHLRGRKYTFSDVTLLEETNIPTGGYLAYSKHAITLKFQDNRKGLIDLAGMYKLKEEDYQGLLMMVNNLNNIPQSYETTTMKNQEDKTFAEKIGAQTNTPIGRTQAIELIARYRSNNK